MQIDLQPSAKESSLILAWHLARSEAASDPYAFVPGRQVYLRHLEGGEVREAPLIWDQRTLEGLVALEQVGPDEEMAARIRDALHRFVVALGGEGDLARLWEASRAGRPSRLVLRFAAAELYALPWEALPIGPGGEALGMLPGLSVQYAWPGVVCKPSEPAPRARSQKPLSPTPSPAAKYQTRNTKMSKPQ